MRRRPRVLAIIASAIVTFGILMATIGPGRFKHGKEHFSHGQNSTCKMHAGKDPQLNTTK